MDGLAYYAAHAPMTELGSLGEVAHSDRLEDLTERIQGWVMHPFHAHRYDVPVTGDAEHQLQNRSAAQILAEALSQDDRPLEEPRPPERRTFGNCRHFTTLFTALLRERGIPARSRCGFGAYFSPPKKADHWVSEVWDAAESRWRLADAQIDDVQRKGMNITIDTLDLGREEFWVAGQAWLRCRRGEADPMDFGILDMWGLWFIRDNLLRDLAALCKVELLPWDAWGQMLTDVEDLSENQLALLDHIAELTTAPILDIAEIRALYEKDESLRVPETIVSFRPKPGPVEIGELARG